MGKLTREGCLLLAAQFLLMRYLFACEFDEKEGEIICVLFYVKVHNILITLCC